MSKVKGARRTKKEKRRTENKELEMYSLKTIGISFF
jgi:hypothetical protein